MMDSNGFSGRMFGSMGTETLGLEMSLQQGNQQHHHQQQQQQNPNQMHQHLLSFGHQELDPPQIQQNFKQGYRFTPKSRTQQLTFSDEDEVGATAEDNLSDGMITKASPWQRMKWTDGMVKLLIMVVFYIGDDQVGLEGNDPACKKGGGVVNGGVVLQKKGKWKSVSNAMMERGFSVSPQQCEDKFNDLNKRYKRVNDILGKGTSCRVVENQSLLEKMDHLSPKTKEEVKKLINSKHLFFREMCAYHNSCGGRKEFGEGAADSSKVQLELRQKKCLHSVEDSRKLHTVGAETQGSKSIKRKRGEDEEDEDDEDDEEEVEGGARGHDNEPHGYDSDEKPAIKRERNAMLDGGSPLVQELSTEVKNVVNDGTKSGWEKKHWMKMRLIELEEQEVNYECEAFELEKQWLKWLKFRSNKEREMEAERLANERMKLLNKRMLLMLRQRELELVQLHRQKPVF